MLWPLRFFVKQKKKTLFWIEKDQVKNKKTELQLIVQNNDDKFSNSRRSPSGHFRRRIDVEIFLRFSTLFRRRNFDLPTGIWRSLISYKDASMKPVKGAWPNHVLTTRFTSTFFEILVPTSDSYFSHSHLEIWHSKIGYLRRNNKKVSNN